MRAICPYCNNRKSYKLRRGSRKCFGCRREYRSNKLPLRLSRPQWKELVHCFVLGLSSNTIAEETDLRKERVLRALSHVRQALAKDIPPAFKGTVEVDETFLGGQQKNRRKAERAKGTKRGRGTRKTPVFGILCREGKVWAEVVPDTKAKTLLGLIQEKVQRGSVVCSDTFRSYTGVAARGYVHRFVRHSEGEYSDRKGSHINGLEGFWGYLKRNLASKGGIRQHKLPLYLAEYVWRYNHRLVPKNGQTKRILKLLEAEEL